MKKWKIFVMFMLLLSLNNFAQDNYSLIKGISYGDDNNQQFDIALPLISSDKKIPIIIFCHGGAYICGTKDDPTPFTRKDLIKALDHGYAVVPIGYRLAPKFKWPAQLEDGIAVIVKLQEIAEQYNLDAENICIIGHSAGGHLALSVGLQKPKIFNREISPIKCIVNYSGLSYMANDNVTAIIKSKTGDFFEPADNLWDDCPAILTVHGDMDKIVPFDHAEYLIKKMNEKNIRGALLQVKGAGHLFEPVVKGTKIYPTNTKTAEIVNMFFKKYLKFGYVADINNDTEITWDDCDVITNAQGQMGYEVSSSEVISLDPEKYNPLADMDNNGYINSDDYSIWHRTLIEPKK